MKTQFNANEIHEIYSLLQRGIPLEQIAAQFSLSTTRFVALALSSTRFN